MKRCALACFRIHLWVCPRLCLVAQEVREFLRRYGRCLTNIHRRQDPHRVLCILPLGRETATATTTVPSDHPKDLSVPPFLSRPYFSSYSSSSSSTSDSSSSSYSSFVTCSCAAIVPSSPAHFICPSLSFVPRKAPEALWFMNCLGEVMAAPGTVNCREHLYCQQVLLEAEQRAGLSVTWHHRPLRDPFPLSYSFTTVYVSGTR